MERKTFKEMALEALKSLTPALATSPTVRGADPN